MPNYKGHLAGGAAAFAITLKITTSLWNTPTITQIPLCLGICMLGSIFPDIDVKSKMQRLFYIAATFFLMGTIFYQLWALFFVATGLILLISGLQHRTLTHNIFFLISLPALIILYISFKNKDLFGPSLLLYSYFVSGTLSHVILDRLVTAFNKLVRK
jgi:membrane-bound metal-dependent hydrolase YbcI (DUF457 family)